ncbi:putative IS200/IS605 family element transposase accessory protein TnpB [Vibrio phage 501E54-1]|nr:putative IS200/IS605 family element transposase accessory protein TnpB [Vibrio phage 501E54-1]
MKTYRYRFMPNKEQQILLDKTFGCVRFIYNNTLAFSKEKYSEGVNTNLNDWSRRLTSLKKEPEFLWLKECSSMPLQGSLRDLDKAFRFFFKGRTRYPRYKKKVGKQSAHYTRNAFKWDAKTNTLKLAKMKKPLKVRWSRSFKGEPSSLQVVKTSSGKYYVNIVVQEPTKSLKSTDKCVGVDLGIKELAVCSDGMVFNNPSVLKKHQRSLSKAQKALSKKVQGSSNYRKQYLKVVKIYEKVVNCRKDYSHKMTKKLVNENQIISVETLRVAGMTKNRRLAKHILDANFGEIIRQLQYKSEWYGKILSKIDTWFPSSKKCSVCDAMYKGTWSLSIREWVCTCGVKHDRDLNAAMNINKEGLRLLS